MKNKPTPDELLIAIHKHCLACSGCRVSELIGIQLKDYDPVNKSIRVFGKGSKYRTVYITADCAVAIDMYLKSRKGQSSYLICSDIKPYGSVTKETVERVIKRLSADVSARSGKRISPHVLRHTFATNIVERGAALQNVQQMLGHASINTTMVYTHVCSQAVRNDYYQHI